MEPGRERGGQSDNAPTEPSYLLGSLSSMEFLTISLVRRRRVKSTEMVLPCVCLPTTVIATCTLTPSSAGRWFVSLFASDYPCIPATQGLRPLVHGVSHVRERAGTKISPIDFMPLMGREDPMSGVPGPRTITRDLLQGLRLPTSWCRMMQSF